VKIALVGAGAIASIHAAHLQANPGVKLESVFTPDPGEASAFAARFGIRNVAASFTEAIAQANLAVIASPSPLHFQQAKDCLDAGIHTLVEIPPCLEAGQVEELGSLAGKRGVQLGCAHTSRFLKPYQAIQKALQQGELGETREINYLRHHKLRDRAWEDNALLHHAAHPLDLILSWCHGFEPIACTVSPDAMRAQAVSFMGKLPNGGTASVTVSYSGHLPQTRMLLVGTRHTVETDGFSYVRSDLQRLQLRVEEEESYHEAVKSQDRAFIDACQGEEPYVAWTETITLMQTLDQLRLLTR
jgi:2-hydroxy-4-carboxymuconate semialdehyde hemiacetal dehydrogenase